MPLRAERAVGAWHDQVIQRAEAAGGARSARALGLVTITALLADGAGRDDDIVSTPRRLLVSDLGEAVAGELLAVVRADLKERVGLLLESEQLRFTAILDAVGPVDPVAAVRLHEAEYALEAAR